MPYAMAIGAMEERILIQRNDAPTLTVTSITRSSTTATVTTQAAHGYATNDYVTIAGADQSDYNGKKKITVTTTTAFTFTVANSPTTPATGGITATYASDAQGGFRVTWRTRDTVWAELVPLRADEQLQVQAIGSQFDLRFRVYVRHDITAKDRVVWTPRWPKGASPRYLEIKGMVPYESGDDFMLLVCGELR